VFSLLTAAALAVPPPLPQPGPPRIDGLEVTYVTPDAFVGALQPDGAEQAKRPSFLQLTLRHDSPLTAEELAAHFAALPGVQAVVDGVDVRLDLGSTEIDLDHHTVGDRPLASLASWVVVPRPLVRMPPHLPPTVRDTGHDLVVTNPIVAGEVEVTVQGLRIGTALPDATVTLRDVRPGDYQVGFVTPTGHTETLTVSARARDEKP
jgi:hypothetical protein